MSSSQECLEVFSDDIFFDFLGFLFFSEEADYKSSNSSKDFVTLFEPLYMWFGPPINR